MVATEITRQFVIHLGVDDDLISRFKDDARSRGMRIIELDIHGLLDRTALVEYLAKVFDFPHKVVGLDAALDLIADLEWLGNTDGHLIVVRGFAAHSVVGDAFVSILRNVVDRWRTQSAPFVVAIDGRGNDLQSTLFAANGKMERAGKLPWDQPGTGAVDTILHGEGNTALEGSR